MSREPTIEDIRRAAADLRTVAVRTPLIEDALLNERVGGRILFKAECLQHPGSFTLRGATTAIHRLGEARRRAGVVAFSSGNHAQGVAAAARSFGIQATIVMPSSAPQAKLDNTRAYGARVVLYDPETESRSQIAQEIADASGASLIRPFDDPDVIAGQGTVGLEIAEQAAELGVTLDALLSPCGGGGLIAGCSLALEVLSPATGIWAIEPDGFDDTRRSLEADERLTNPPGASSICDAILTEGPGTLTFEINRRRLAGGLSVSDAEVAEALRTIFSRLKLVVEPSGCVGLAAILAGRHDVRGRTVAVVLSGGNVDPASFASLLSAA